MQKIKKTILMSVIASESIHVFCCFLPTIFSVFSLLAGFGMIATMPHFMETAHHLIHGYEIPMMILSAFVLIFGWILYAYAQKMDCDNEPACQGTPCNKTKLRTKKIMQVATILFVVNVTVYFLFHYQQEQGSHGHQDHVIVEQHHDMQR